MSKKTPSSELPTEVEHFDLIDLERHQLREENAKIKMVALQAALDVAQREGNEFKDKFRKKYKMTENDRVDSDTRKIIRGK